MKNFLTTTALGMACVLGSIQVTHAEPAITEPTSPAGGYTLPVRGGHGGGHSFGGPRGDFGGDVGADRGAVARHDDRAFRRNEAYNNEYGYGDYAGVGYGDYVGTGIGGDVGGCVTLEDGSVFCN